MKQYAEKKHSFKQSSIRVGDSILVRQNKINKLTPPYDPKPFKVVSVKGSMITAERDARTITRNSSFFKVFNFTEEEEEMDQLDFPNGEHSTTQEGQSGYNLRPSRKLTSRLSEEI
ncbi:hypothetical protein HOLleu_16375 [Holothuria leucospilota]|uniref:Uncharacterized protein n=1 Tax=Holothuria leucospilota TaxID=206669 RepID=A0A9Q1HAC6_HOLLE|nr:hypothetical protein HOLleu_16375 [Holothuria leucospilota]